MQKKSAVIHFIEDERTKGTSDKEIQHQLLDAGWHMDIIQHAMHAKPQQHKVQKVSKPKQNSYQYAFTVIKQPKYLAIAFIVLALVALFL